MDIKKADSKGRVSGFEPDRHYFITGPMDGSYRVKEVPTVSHIPEGYLPSEIVDAQNAVLDLLYENGLDGSEDDLISISADIVGLFQNARLLPVPVVK